MASSFDNLHQVLRHLYTDMMPLTEHMTTVATAIAGLGALFYIAHRIWQSLSRAEPIDVYPLLRPFVLGLCIAFFPVFVLGTLNTILSPVVQGCAVMLEGQVMDMEAFRKQKKAIEDEALLKSPETAYLVSNEEFDKRLNELGWSPSDLVTISSMYVERGMYNMKQSITKGFQDILELMFDAAALAIDTIRTFFLLVLSILGPIAFALSVYDGFQNTLVNWLARYISIYLWLPVSDLFSSVMARLQVLMIRDDIARMQSGGVAESGNTMYILFLIIGIIGYFTIPTVAGWIITSGGTGAYNRNVNAAAGRTGNRIGGVAGAALGNITGRLMP